MSELPEDMTEFHEVREGFSSLDTWRAFVAQNPWVYDRSYIERLVARVRLTGLRSEYFGPSGPADVAIQGPNYRETIVQNGCSSRMRAMLDEVLTATSRDTTARILMLEALTPFALAVRGRYHYALGTEYLATSRDAERYFPIPHCDIMESSFKPGSFDLLVSNDVLEHVPDIERAMRESRRILRAGGVCLATFPFGSGAGETLIRARLRGGQVEHVMPPEYHGNPVNPSGGSLVFGVPGWDILALCRSVGFKSAQMLFVSSVNRGITGSDCAGIHILRAEA